MTDADDLDAILTRLRRMEIDIIEASEVDRFKDGKKEAEEEEEEKPETKLDILDDPVRMYLKQMGQVPLLTREQEVEISKRIEEAESMVQKQINRFGFIARAHLDLAEKLTEGRERFDRVILDKKITFAIRPADLAQTATNFVFSEFKVETIAPAPAEIPRLNIARVGENMVLSWPTNNTARSRFCGAKGQNVLVPARRILQRSQRCRRLRRSSGCRLMNTPSSISSSKTGFAKPCEPKPKWWKPTCAWSSRSRKNTRIAVSPSSISFRKAIWV